MTSTPANPGTEITTTSPDDFHLHVRDGEVLNDVVWQSARYSERALIMPNLKPPVTTVAQALGYRKRILAAVPPGMNFEPLMTLYLTNNTLQEEIQKASDSGVVPAVKYYPAGATTNSDAGVTDIKKTYHALEKAQATRTTLCIHGEVTDPTIDIFDREKYFLDYLYDVRTQFPELRIVLEHITTKEGIAFVKAANHNTAATITPHHLLMNRNAIFQGGIRAHNYCLPVAKREEHRVALLEAATSGNPKFFLGTDSAPHAVRLKEASCGCAGCYTSPAGIELCAEAFDSVGKINMLEGFVSHFGAYFYRLPRNKGTITLVKKSWTMPPSFPFGHSDKVVPFRAGEQISWLKIA